MRRPHVYERSAPRSVRSPYHEPPAGPGAAVTEIATALAGLVSKADALELSSLAGLLRAALDEARCVSAAGRLAPPDLDAGETPATVAAEAMAPGSVRDMSKVLTQTKASTFLGDDAALAPSASPTMRAPLNAMRSAST